NEVVVGEFGDEQAVRLAFVGQPGYPAHELRAWLAVVEGYFQRAPDQRYEGSDISGIGVLPQFLQEVACRFGFGFFPGYGEFFLYLRQLAHRLDDGGSVGIVLAELDERV